MRTNVRIATLLLLLLPGQAIPAEELTNPFGGRPPENAPGLPSEPPLSYREEVWLGTLLGHSRRISISSEFFKSGREVFVSMYSQKGDEYCVLVARDFRVTDTSLYIPSTIGGCWTELGNDQYRDIGGVRYGAIDCTFVPATRKGLCTYRSESTGKLHQFAVRAVEYVTN